MDKAFLCHSSADKEYVESVAKRLGRAKVVFDAMSFREGRDFRDEIQAGLTASALFVFFVSRASLASIWTRYELDEAHLRRIKGEMRGQLAIIIDPLVTFSELPAWMQRLRAIAQPRPVQAAREIERELFSIAPTSAAAKPFVGRQGPQQEFVRELAVSMDVGPKIFAVSGLEGIGRRSYLQRVLLDNLGLTLGPSRVIDQTATLEDLFLWLLDETGEVMSRADLARELEIFRQLLPDQQLSEVGARFDAICDGRFIPCLVNRGGLLDDRGRMREPYDSVISAFGTNEDRYLAIIDTRAAVLSGSKYEERTLQQRLEPLSLAETRILLQQLMKREGLAASDDVLVELASYIGGYPPAAYFVVRQAKTYGLAAAVADKSLLVDFKARRFTRFLTDIGLQPSEWDVLSYLAAEQTVPLAAIAVALARDTDDVARVVRKLIDNSLVLVADDNLAISPPIRDAVIRARGHLSADVYGQIRDRLTAAFWAPTEAAPTIEVVDATLHAVARSGLSEFESYRDLVRASTVHRLARESYFRREYEQALAYAGRAQEMGANNQDVRAIHFKALVRLERWSDAEARLAEIAAKGDRDYLYLKGFMFRRQRQFKAACDAYEAALEAGDSSFALHRDYADCLHRLGKLREAVTQIRSVLGRQTENIYALDLVLRIYLDSLRAGEDVVATHDVERYLRDLERFDVDERFIHHRRATLLAAQERWQQALTEVERALVHNPRAFESVALRCDVLIEMDRFDEAASAIQEMNQNFKTDRDVQLGLAIKLATRQGRWREAQALWNNLKERDRPIHQVLLMRIKELESQDTSLSLGQRRDAEMLVQGIRKRVRLPRVSPVLDAILEPSGSEDE